MVACIRRWKVAGADARPIGILVYSYKPKGVVNAVLCWSRGSMEIWWYPLARSKVEKYWAPTPGEWVGITKSWRYAPVGLHDCGIIAGGDAVLHCLSIPKIEVILGKTLSIQVQQGMQPGSLVVSAVKCRAGNSIRGCRLCDGGFHGDGHLVAGRHNLHTLVAFNAVHCM